jgi:hypothetical protein
MDMSNLALVFLVVVQISMAAMLGLLMLRNGRNGNARYTVAAETSHPYSLAAIDKPADASQIYRGIPIDAKLLELDKRALDEAYHAQLQNLWLVWLKGQAGDPSYFTNGLKIARRAYAQANEQIAKREAEIKGGR